VVDGIPVSSIADIPPQMVKSIEVLKGSSGAIYGSRGANGAILIDLKGAPLKDPLPVIFPGKVPFATTQPATNIQVNGATLNGTVSANDLPTSVTFEYGTTPGYGNAINADQSPLEEHLYRCYRKDFGTKAGITYHYQSSCNKFPWTTI
jgi:TonB-dependent SusC/RagA subfamily outer membrane receptor